MHCFWRLEAWLLTFLPQEISETFTTTSSPLNALCLQLLGATYLGMAMLNWYNKEKLLRGIYGRPIILMNLLHFFVGSMTLIRAISAYESITLYMLTMLYGCFAVAFGYVLLNNPKAVN